MRQFDPKLMEILKTETEYERLLRTSQEAREDFTRKITGEGEPQRRNEVLSDPVSVGRVVRYVQWPAHRNRLLEMSYVVSGTSTVTIAGEDILLRAGDFFLPNQYTEFSRAPLGEDDIVINLVMLPQFHEQLCVQLKEKTVLSEFMLDIIRRDISWNQYLHFSDVGDIGVWNLAETLAYAAFPYLDDGNIRCGCADNPEITAMLTTALFSALSHNLSSLSDHSFTNLDQIIRETTSNYIGTHYKTASLQELAQIVNQSESALSRQIKSVFGFTFKDLLLQKRFERAVELLQQTDLSVGDVACAVGYENTSFFYRRFREIYGHSPKDCRARS
jgi:AraC-like DNA-binding protein/mannose-6-phosphate isomerase-like protein (cupin superfamily)